MDEIKPFTDRIAVLQHDLGETRQRAEAAEAEIKRLMTVDLQRYESSDGKFEAYLRSELTPHLAAMLWGALEEKQAVNYIELTVTHPEKGRAVVTIQKLEGKTPHQLRLEAEVKIGRLEQEISTLLGPVRSRASKVSENDTFDARLQGARKEIVEP